MSYVQMISISGAVLILTAFTLAQLRKLEMETATYQLLNFFGGVALLYAAIVEVQYGFILMEGCWSIVSLYGFAKVLRKPAA